LESVAQAIANARAAGRKEGAAELGKVFVGDMAKLAGATATTPENQSSVDFAKRIADATELSAWRETFRKHHAIESDLAIPGHEGEPTHLWPETWDERESKRIGDLETHVAALQGRQAALLALVERTACTLETVGGTRHADWLREQSKAIVINSATSILRAKENGR
jgi:hypothetical protein